MFHRGKGVGEGGSGREGVGEEGGGREWEGGGGREWERGSGKEWVGGREGGGGKGVCNKML